MIPLVEFWGANHYENPPLTDAALVVAEQRLGVTLPTEYVDLLRIQNGGCTAGFAHPMMTETSWAENHVPCHEMAGIVVEADHDGMHDILLTESMTSEWDLPPGQVLLAGDGHWWITLDYRRSDVPAVTWLDVEAGEDIEVAPTFRDFLEGLVPASQFEDTLDEAAAEGITVTWRPERMEATLEEGLDSVRMARSLLLEQHLDPGVPGWTMSRIDLPPSWEVLSLAFEGVDLRLSLVDGRKFRINGDNFGALSSSVLECNSKDVAALEEAWRIHAGE